MVAAWPEPVERVSSYLREAGAEARIEQFPDGTQSASDAAAAVGCELGQIVKSLVLVCEADTVVALVPGDRKVDTKKVASALGVGSARVAKPDEVTRATGFPPGGVAPFALTRIETVLLDRRLLGHPVVWAGAGSTSHVVGLAPAELMRVAQARPVDVVQDETYDFSGRLAGEAQPKER